LSHLTAAVCRQCPSTKFIMSFHTKCRFPNEYMYKAAGGVSKRIARKEVPAGFISWDIDFPEYDPITFTAGHIEGQPWADPDMKSPDFKPQWNKLDGQINRVSHEGPYRVQNGFPLNVRGRTGLRGRGILGRYGPNHAADPVVTRWKRDPDSGEVITSPKNGRQILQFVGIQRRDTGEWAIPGGMVDAGENVSATVRREFVEEALNGLEMDQKDRLKAEEMVAKFFADGHQIYAGYVDDPRNTDWSWMETTAFLFHDESGESVGRMPLQAGDDAKALKWIDISSEINLYASHKEFIEKAVYKMGAHW